MKEDSLWSTAAVVVGGGERSGSMARSIKSFIGEDSEYFWFKSDNRIHGKEDLKKITNSQ